MYVEPYFSKKQVDGWKDMLLITLFSGFRNGRLGGWGVLVMARNGCVRPKLAKMEAIQRKRNPSPVYEIGHWRSQQVHDITCEAQKDYLDEMWVVGLPITCVWGGYTGVMRKKRPKNTILLDEKHFFGTCHTGTDYLP